MYHRYHPNSNRNSSGKWERIPHSGVGEVTREKIGNWQIEVSHRQVGVTIKRDQFTAILRREAPAYEETLPAFSNKAAALQAARKRVDLLSHVRGPIARGPHRVRRKNYDAK